MYDLRGSSHTPVRERADSVQQCIRRIDSLLIVRRDFRWHKEDMLLLAIRC